MTINAFEGARRVAVLISAFAIVITIWVSVYVNPYLTTTYLVPTPTMEPIKVSRSCKSEERKVYANKMMESGSSISVHLCFKPMDFGKSGILIPYRVDEKGMTWGNSSYSTDVSNYVDDYAAKFQIPQDDLKVLNQEWKKLRWSEIKENVTNLIIGLASFWFAVWMLGWIVRGFFGIPRGADRRPIAE